MKIITRDNIEKSRKKNKNMESMSQSQSQTIEEKDNKDNTINVSEEKTV